MPDAAPPSTLLPSAGYRGRFAPSPTGPLHFGSLVAALASWLRARACAGSWIIRIEDLDPPRERAGAADHIINTLSAFGMTSDAPILLQSQRHPLYRAALQRLIAQGDAFACACTRRDLEPSGLHHGACTRVAGPKAAWRMRVATGSWSFDDQLLGTFRQQCADVVDFVLWRADGLPAYQLAVVIDDHAQGITEVVRGADLLDSTPRQIHLQRALGLPTPAYLHVPLALDADGHKLSKSMAALPIDGADPMPALRAALQFLGQPSHPDLLTVDALLRVATTAFEIAKIPHVAMPALAISTPSHQNRPEN